ncbi:MAG: sulfotransferase domain-containing protein [Actinomycetota bacterium]|nr:sulfotransferase domain-containing protein [Actinomycetota bacterium]
MPLERTVKRALTPVTGPRSRRAIIDGRDLAVGAAAAVRARMGLGRAPAFVIVGAQKAGTTFLYQEITRHPDLGAALTKEIHFFDDHYRRGLRWYRGFFPNSPGLLLGESSPGYLFHPHAVARIARDLPDVKLLVLLRDPARRAFSHYLHESRLGYEPAATFDQALALEPSRLDGELEAMAADDGYVSYRYRHFSYRSRGLYLDQVKRCHDLVGQERVKVIRSEDLYRPGSTVQAEVFAYLGVRPWQPDAPGRNDMAADRTARMDPGIEAELREFYRPHNDALFAYLGWEGGWKG